MKLRFPIYCSIDRRRLSHSNSDSTRKRTFYLIDYTSITFPGPCHSCLKLLAARNALAHDTTDGCNTLALLWKRSLPPLRVKPGISRDVIDVIASVCVWLPVYFQQTWSSKPRQSIVSIAFADSSHPRVKIPHGFRIYRFRQKYSRDFSISKRCKMSDYAMRRSSSLSDSYANFEGYFSEEYFRASVIDGMTRVVLNFFFFFVILKSNARCVYFRLEQALAIAYLCAGARQLSFYLFSGIISKLDQVTEPSPRRDSQAYLAKLSSYDYRAFHWMDVTKVHEQSAVFIFFSFFSSNRTSSFVLSKRLIIRRKQAITKSIVCIDTRWITIDAPSWRSRKINVRHRNVSY